MERLDWHREMLYLLAVAMEVSWFAPWYLALIPATAQLPSGRTAVGLFVMMVIPTYAARTLEKLDLKPVFRALVLSVLLLATCLLALRVFLYAGQGYTGLDWLGQTLRDVLDVYRFIPDWFVIILSTLFLWWRGVSLGQRRPSVRAVALHFYGGIVAFIGFALIVSTVSGDDPAPFIPVFFFFSLTALAVTRLETMRGWRGALYAPVGLSWLLAVAISAFGVVGLGAAFGALLMGQGVRGALQWLEPLFLMGFAVLGLLLTVLMAVVDWVLGILRSLGVANATSPISDFVQGLGDLMPEGADVALPAPSGMGAVRLVLMMALLALMGALVVLALGRQSWLYREREESDDESLMSPSTLAMNVRQFINARRKRLRVALSVVERSGLRGLFAAMTVRRAYANMCRLAAERGYPRAASQTPYEYEPSASRAFLGATTEVHVITEAYVAVHYGEVPETEAELQKIRACWSRLRQSRGNKT